jgi:hypothetical protein
MKVTRLFKSSYRTPRRCSCCARVDVELTKLIEAHEAKHGPGLPTSKARGWRGWQAARELLVGINKTREFLDAQGD